MRELILSAQDQRAFLAEYLNQPEVIHQQDTFRRKIDELIGEAYHRDELALGVALVSLTAARAAGLEAAAAGSLMGLIANRERSDWSRLRTCRVCGCTDLDCSGCVERTGGPCHWVEEDLCSACVRVGEGGAS